MCGICGIIHFNQQPVQEKNLQTMMTRMKHRGPDDEGIFIENNVGLGFVRLSIIDLTSAGHQPMFSDDQRFVLVFNGEIYNYIELREELKSKYRFLTQTDTEVLLNAYREWGKKCLHKLNGMFSFVIYDKKNKDIFCARDRFGIKPFYYYQDQERFIFSSEIAPILLVTKKRTRPNPRSIFDFLAYNKTDQTEDTFFKDIKKLQHGHTITLKDHQLKIFRWYHLRENLKDPFQHPEDFRTDLSRAIGLRLRSDVPVGVCLSGGLDSSSIVSLLLKDHQKKDLNTFSAVYQKGLRCDESEYIDLFKNNLRHMHRITPSANTLLEDMHGYVRAHNEPTPSTSPYAQFKVMELAQRHVKVTLDGQGADEELAGYHYFYGYFFKELLYKLKLIKLFSETMHYLIKHRSLLGVKSFVFFLLPEKFQTRARSSIQYIDDQFKRENSQGSVITEKLYASRSLKEALIDHFEYKLEHLLKWEDRNSMWFSLESRVPFLDHQLVERALAMEGTEKISKGMTKAILRNAMKGVLPEKIRNRRDDIGFDTPEDNWFRETKLQEFIQDLLHSKSFSERGFIQPEKARKLYSEHLTGSRNISKEIWKWIHLELWFREFIDP
jgi:asparagine synthase (glutamine-hydrolysing)